MTDEIEIIPAVAGQKNKASTYNENFNRMKNFVNFSVADLQAETQEALSVYQTVNTLATSGEVELTDNSVNTITPAGEVEFVLPTITGAEAGKFHQILVQLSLSDTSYITADDDKLGTNYFFNGEKPRFNYTGNYDIIYSYDNANSMWCVGAIFKGVVS